jgi:hypothetical protein
MDISQHLHHILLGMDATAGVARATTTRAIVIGGFGDDLASLHYNRTMQGSPVFHPHGHGAGVFQEFLKDPGLGSVKLGAVQGSWQRAFIG